ncbi:monovalent cation/H(+) antiporter subunit G [Marinimicrobium sp. ABcell2]|uniref:monovalent cation/H(+) antiporter subunit G n=1 Tax=Marinimicrobium sp. ABcell2 TaxID=3069751 RepID=UPI0027B33CE3|nr:monovalent cation/H(+) antiporter subunit G [Marinimicrobium sp. ABcell2]MDQ2078137.1 monovalent cation/H(+) antiporter subunit G [Marinimicrobium sp. ABcell2]
MNEVLYWLSWPPLLVGTFFFVAGTVGMLRFPDVYSRLHALTKADTLGLGLIVLGLCLRAQTWQEVPVMIFIWLLIVASGATACQLLARYQREQEAGIKEERRAQP